MDEKTREITREIAERMIEAQGAPGKLTPESQMYLKGAVDFIKWTSTINIAAMLWIGNNITSITEPSQRLAAAALVLLAVSLIASVLMAKRVIIAWAKQWTLTDTTNTVRKIGKLSNALLPIHGAEEVKGEIELKRREEEKHYRTAIEAALSHSKPKGFNALISLHIGLLLAGLICYTFAQINTALGFI